MSEVFCIAGTNCDLIFAGLEQFPALGIEVECKDFAVKAGGGSNTPMALARLGLQTSFATEIGRDTLGDITYKYIQDTGVDMSAVLYEHNIRTSVTSVLSIGSERGFATYLLDSIQHIRAEDLEPYIAQASHIHTYVGYCLRYPIIEMAKEYHKTVSLDTSWSGDMKLRDIGHILEGCSVFLPNESEACSLTDCDNSEDALRELAHCCNTVAVKLGEKGCIVKDRGAVHKVPAVPGIPAVDTTGAGDLFCAGFIYGYVKGWGLEKTARFANASGGLGITFYGGMDVSYNMKGVLGMQELMPCPVR